MKIKIQEGALSEMPLSKLATAFAMLGLELVARPDGTILARPKAQMENEK